MERELKAAQAAKQERIREHEWHKAIEETEVRRGDSFIVAGLVMAVRQHMHFGSGARFCALTGCMCVFFSLLHATGEAQTIRPRHQGKGGIQIRTGWCVCRPCESCRARTRHDTSERYFLSPAQISHD